MGLMTALCKANSTPQQNLVKQFPSRISSGEIEIA